jgi:hypothetical protein
VSRRSLTGMNLHLEKEMHMKKSEAFPSKFLKAADLGGKSLVLTIKSVSRKTLKTHDGKEQEKTVLHFVETDKVLPLNLTNWDAVAAATGEDDDANWPDHKIEAFPTTVIVGTESKPCVRIRAPEQGELLIKQQRNATAKPPVADDMDDEIPF